MTVNESRAELLHESRSETKVTVAVLALPESLRAVELSSSVTLSIRLTLSHSASVEGAQKPDCEGCEGRV